jgi:tetratricopeptide (TPR) repeat protein
MMVNCEQILSLALPSNDQPRTMVGWIGASAYSLFLLASSSQRQVLQVCLSPGCLADGARETLEKLQALCPSANVAIEEGVCVSLCGKGPVVIQNPDTKKMLHKRVEGEVVLKLLQEELGTQVPNALLEGYDLVLKANQAASKKSHQEAVELYQKAIDTSITLAKENGTSLSWIVRALRSLATSQLALFQKQAALDAINKALEIDYQNMDSLEIKSHICQAMNDVEGEYGALKAYFDLPVENLTSLPREVQNRRRTLGFRLQKLERMLQ